MGLCSCWPASLCDYKQKILVLYSKIALILAFIIMLQHFVVAQNEEYDPNWCELEAEFGPENCPIQRGDYDRCVTCTSTYFYSCGCCFEVVDEIGLNPNRCSTW